MSDEIRVAVEGLDFSDLNTQGRVVCYVDISCEMSWQDSLHDREEMERGVTHSDSICSHCRVVDREDGLGSLPRDLAKRVFGDIRMFDKYREERRLRELCGD